MKQQRLATPQKTLYGVPFTEDREEWSKRSDPYKDVPFAEDVPMQQWEKVGWSIIAGLLLGFVAFGGLLGFPW